MSQQNPITAQKREGKGSRFSRRLRAEGRIPGILYGHGEDAVNISLDTTEFRSALRHGAHGLLSLALDGNNQSVVIKDLQYDHLGIEIFHVDFARVSADERVTTSVPIHVKGTPDNLKGGVLEQPLHEIDVECPASNLVEHIVVNIKELSLGDSITVGDLVLPEGAKALADADTIVIHVVKAAGESEETAATEGAAAEPEVIRREKEAEESED